MAEVSKEKTDKKDEDVAAKNKDLQTLRGEVDIVKQYIKSKAETEAKKTAKETKETKEANYQKGRLSKNISGLGGLASLSPGLGKQSFKK
tara:strand:+ start:1177 stop:1446 length:270 start_codon:yes stop_codon:yes gene_type:complete